VVIILILFFSQNLSFCIFWGKDNTYTQANKKEYKKIIFKWCNPFHIVYHAETATVETIWNFPGICLLSDKIIKRIANPNQCIENFNSYLDKINTLSNSINPIIIIKIKETLDKKIPSMNALSLKRKKKYLQTTI